MQETENDLQFLRREFLNSKEQAGIAAIFIEVHKTNGIFFNSLDISDCNRTISLDIDLGVVKSYNNTMYKLKTMIEVLEEAMTFIENNCKPDD